MIFSTNAFHADEPTQIAFADINLRPRTLTADRREFFGRHGSVRQPATKIQAAITQMLGTMTLAVLMDDDAPALLSADVNEEADADEKEEIQRS